MSGKGRGRKAKKEEPVVVAPVVNDIIEKPKAVRGGRKKQFPVIAVITPDGIEGSLQPEVRRPLISHLPIQSRDVIFHDEPLKYDPVPPTDVAPFGSFIDNPFSEESEFVPIVMNEMCAKKGSVAQPISQHAQVAASSTASSAVKQEAIDYYRKGQLLVQFKGTEELRTIPTTSTSACLWCCHTFEGRPVVLPVRDHGDYLNVCGNFCCPECAMAYLFDMRQDSHMRWEQLALLNRVYADTVGGRIYPAPYRTVLSLFGGLYSIEEYRAMIRQQKVRMDVHLPPMVSILVNDGYETD